MSQLDHTLKLMPQSQRELAKDEIKALILDLASQYEILTPPGMKSFDEAVEAL